MNKFWLTRVLLIALVLGVFAVQTPDTFAAEEGWFVSFEEAKAAAAKESKKVTVEIKSQTTKKPILETKVRVKVKGEKPTITETQHVINLFKLLIKDDINVDNISFKRNKLNNKRFLFHF